MHAADSDSVNLGSNPSPPATVNPVNSALLAPGHDGRDSPDGPIGRTEVGTVLAAVARARPDLARLVESIRRDLATTTPDDLRWQMTGLEAALRGGA